MACQSSVLSAADFKGGSMWRRAWFVAAIVMSLTVAFAPPTMAQQGDDAAALIAEAKALHRKGKFVEAVSIARRALSIRENALGPDHPDVARMLNTLGDLLRINGHNEESIRLHQRALGIFERGPLHADVATSLNNLGLVSTAIGNDQAALSYHRRALDLREKVLGLDDSDTAWSLNNLGDVLNTLNLYDAAEDHHKRALAIREKLYSPEHPDVAFSYYNLARVAGARGDYATAEQLHRRALEIREKVLPPDHRDVAWSLQILGDTVRILGRYNDAQSLQQRAFEMRQRLFGAFHAEVAQSLNALGLIAVDRADYSAAESYFRRSLDIREKVLPADHPDTAWSLDNVAVALNAAGRAPETVQLHQRALAIRERLYGNVHSDVAISLNNLGSIAANGGDYAMAESYFRRSFNIRQQVLGAEHPETAFAMSNLARTLSAVGRLDEATLLHKQALAIRQRVYGPSHAAVADSLHSLAVEAYRREDFSTARSYVQQDLVIREKELSADHVDTIGSLNLMAALSMAEGDWPTAAEFGKRATSAMINRKVRRVESVDQSSFQLPEGEAVGEIERNPQQFQMLVKMVSRTNATAQEAGPTLLEEMFETAQWAQNSQASRALAEMAARGGRNKPELGTLIRQRQDLLVEWQRRDRARIGDISKLPSERERENSAKNADRLAEIEARIADIDKSLASDFPDYAALVSPKPMSIADVKQQLREGEALVLFLDTPGWKPTSEETFIWVVTKADSRWVKSDLGTASLQREVAALRCGLDNAAWRGDGEKDCQTLLNTTFSSIDIGAQKPLPFDHMRAHKLYTALFGQVEDLIAGTELFLVPSGPLTQLPFQVLVTHPPQSQGKLGNAHRSIAWLAKKHAISVLPSVSSLAALRRIGKPSRASEPLIGFGNPLLNGDQKHPEFGNYYKKQAKLARDRQSCPKAPPKTPLQQFASHFGLRGGIEPLPMRRSLADQAHLKVQAPLPETAEELCAVALDLGTNEKSLRLGARATEQEIKSLSANGKLANYRIVHFATHGTLAGQLKGTNEPGLILTPPDTPTEKDDGFLTASEIADLKLDADWVILSACNTAGGAGDGAEGGEALSGLARSFFYAQARALLVSHWEVNSIATVKLITSAVSSMSKDKSIGRAKALQSAMLNLIDHGKPHEAHPAYWAPFVMVGEGGDTAGRAQ